MSRKPIDIFFLELAYTFAKRSTCERKKVGCVIVRGKHLIATGYNGSLPDLDHCDDVGCLIVDGGCVRTSHAEASAITQAARYGHSLLDTTAYITMQPCLKCYKLLCMSGIRRIVYNEDYRIKIPDEIIKVKMEQLNLSEE